MKFKNLKELKEHYTGRVASYKGDIALTETNFKPRFHLGTKRMEVLLMVPEGLLGLTATLHEVIDNVLLVQLDFDSKDYNKEFYVVDKYEEMTKAMYQMMVEAWSDYADIKKLEGIMFGIPERRIRAAYFNYFFEGGPYKEYKYVNRIWNMDENYFDSAWGKLSEGKQEKLRTAKAIRNKMEEIRKLDPTLVLEKVEMSFKRVPYILSLYRFTYQKEVFALVPEGDRLLFQGVTMGEKEYPLSVDSVVPILEMIQTEKRLENLFHPAVTNTCEMFSTYLNVRLSTEKLEELVRDLDGEIGVGETEKEMFYVMKLIDYAEGYDQGWKKEQKSIVTEFLVQGMKIYRVKTDNYYWFLLGNPKNRTVRMKATDCKKLPADFLQLMNEWANENFD